MTEAASELDFSFDPAKNRLEAWPNGRAFMIYVLAATEQMILEQTRKHPWLDALRRVAESIPNGRDESFVRFEKILRTEPFGYACLWRDLASPDLMIECRTVDDFLDRFLARFP